MPLRQPANGFLDAGEVGQVWSEARIGSTEAQRPRRADAAFAPERVCDACGSPLRLRANRKRIALPSSVAALRENLVRPVADLLVRTDADAHGLPLLLWLNARRKQGISPGTQPVETHIYEPDEGSGEEPCRRHTICWNALASDCSLSGNRGKARLLRRRFQRLSNIVPRHRSAGSNYALQAGAVRPAGHGADDMRPHARAGHPRPLSAVNHRRNHGPPCVR